MKLKKLIGYALIGIGCVSLTACHDLYVEDGYYDGSHHHGNHPPPPSRDGSQKGHPPSHGSVHHSPAPASHGGKDTGPRRPQAGPANRMGKESGSRGNVQERPAEHGPQGKMSSHSPQPHPSGNDSYQRH